MSGEYGFNMSAVTKKNLEDLSQDGSTNFERIICELDEHANSAADFAEELFGEGLDIYEILSLLAQEPAFSLSPPHDGALSENVHRLHMASASMLSAGGAIFADFLTGKLKKRGFSITEKSFFPPENADELFTYVRNPYSDEAYDVFSQDFSDPRLKYSQSFKNAVASVLAGEVTYALFPLEESGGARLPTVSELIYKNDLKINSVTPVFGADGASELKYALVSRRIVPFDINADDDRYLEIRIGASTKSLYDIIYAAELYGIEVYRINTVALSAEDGSDSFFGIVFRGEGCDFTKMLVYLTLFTDDFVAVGMYKNLE